MINSNDVLSVIKESLTSLNVETLKLDVKLGEQGIDSLDRTSIYFELEEKFGVKLVPEEENKYQSVNDLVVYINAKK
jgi:acyl carrier protein